MATVINTHNLFNALKASGFDEKQANEVLNTVEAMQNARLEEVATKADLATTKAEIKTDLAELKADLRIVQWGIALIIAVLVLPYLKTLFV